MTAPDATSSPDENLLELPASWKKELFPRSGLPPLPVDESAPAKIRARMDQMRDEIAAALTNPDNNEFADAIQAELAGEANPLGAAAVKVLADRIKPHADLGNFVYFDAWRTEHGLPFAVAALVQDLSLMAQPLGTYWQKDAQYQVIQRLGIDSFGGYWRNGPVRHQKDALHRIRAQIVAAAPSEYARVVAAVASHRDKAGNRLVASLLLPTEVEWVTESCIDFAQNRNNRGTTWALASIMTTAEHLAACGVMAIDPYEATTATLAGLTQNLKELCLPVIQATLESPNASSTAADRKLLWQAIALLPSDEAMAFLVDNLSVPHVIAALAQAISRFPKRALRTIAAAAMTASEQTRRTLGGLISAHQVLVELDRQYLSPAEQAVVAELLDTSGQVPLATAAQLPQLLVKPVWTVKRPKTKAMVIDGLMPSMEPAIIWADGEQESWAAAAEHDHSWMRKYWKREVDDIGKAGATYSMLFFAYAPLDLVRPLVSTSVPVGLQTDDEQIKRVLARFELAMADQVLDRIIRDRVAGEALLPIRTFRVAQKIAEWFHRSKSMRKIATAWLDRHGQAGAALLVPDALAKPAKPRAAAGAALRYLAATKGDETVLAGARPYGAQAVEAVTAMLSVDPLDPVGAKIPKPADWVIPAMLPPVLLADRSAALPPSAVNHLLTVLAIDTPEFPYAGVDLVGRTCDQASLSEFCWAVFGQWVAAGGPAKDGWALTQLAHFADDDVVRKLTPMIRAWPGESQHKRAVTGLEVLGRIGSEAALRAIHGISQKVKFKALKQKAAEQIQQIAANLGLTTEQLGDRLVPDFGLDDASTLVIDYGPRQFRVGFDEQLKPFVTDADGKPRKSLPKPGARDDSELAQASYKRFSLLKKDLRSVAADQVARLERAMAAGRAWSLPEFTELFAGHPLVWHLARRLVWIAALGDRQVAFRLAEDRSLTDVDEQELQLPETASIRLAHPILLGDSLGAWSEILADYEILQPFAQLSRPVMAFTADELATGELKRFVGVTVPTGKILGLVSKGWARARPEDAGCEPGLSFALPGGGYIVIELDPGIVVGMVDEFPEQTLRAVRLSNTEDYGYFGNHESGHPKTIDPVTASEVLAGLSRITKVS